MSHKGTKKGRQESTIEERKQRGKRMQYTINQLRREIKELEEMMMCLTSTEAIHRMIVKRDKLEEKKGSFIRINKLYLSNKNRVIK